MTWYFGYRFKWKHVRRLAKEQGFLDEKKVFGTEFRVRNFLYSQSKVNIRFVADYKDYIICFHKSAVRGDLSGLKADMAQIMDVGRIFYGKDHKPRWFASRKSMGAEEDSSEDEELPPQAPPGYFDPPDGLPLEVAQYFEAKGEVIILEDEDLADEECKSLSKEGSGEPS